MSEKLPPPPQAVVLPCRRCRREHGPQIFDLITMDQERYIHQYMCRRCGINERLTTHFARDRAAEERQEH